VNWRDAGRHRPMFPRWACCGTQRREEECRGGYSHRCRSRRPHAVGAGHTLDGSHRPLRPHVRPKTTCEGGVRVAGLTGMPPLLPLHCLPLVVRLKVA
jgi:hypothetical protein